MTQDLKKLRRLQQVAEVLADRDLAEVAAQSARCENITRRIADIDTHRAKLALSAADPMHAAMMGHQSERLRRYKTSELERLARERAELEKAKAKARPSFGRQAVLKKLIEMAREAKARKF